jgi:hypothetical protein
MQPVWSVVRRLSSKYRGATQNDAIRRARAERVKPKHLVTSRNIPNQSPPVPSNKVVILRRNESKFARYLGAAAGLHAIGALAFCGVVLRGADIDQPAAELRESDPSPLQKFLVVGAAITTSIAAFLLAARFGRNRLVEIRLTGPSIQMYTRSLRGLNAPFMAHEVAARELYVDFRKLRSASKYVGMSASELKQSNVRDPRASLLNFSIRNGGGSTYAVDARELSVLDTQVIESVSVDWPEDVNGNLLKF